MTTERHTQDFPLPFILRGARCVLEKIRRVQACKASRRPLPTCPGLLPSPLPAVLQLCAFLSSFRGPTSLPPQLTLGSSSLSSLLLSLSLVYSYVVSHLTSQVTFSAKWSYIGPLPSHPDSHVMSFYSTQDFSVEHLSRFSLHIFMCLVIHVYFSH